jgi:signal transduction histidine kinase
LSDQLPAGVLQLDIEAILRGTQVLSGELEHDELLRKAVEILLAVSSASHLVLVRREDGKYWIRAHGSAVGGVVNSRVNATLVEATPDQLPLSLHERVSLSGEVLVIDDPARDSRFSADPYLAAHQPRSVLCFQNLNSGQYQRFQYFEHHTLPGVFIPQVIQILRAVSANIDIALENAALVQRLEAELTEHRRTQDALRELARERTEHAALAQALSDLGLALANRRGPTDIYAIFFEHLARVVACTRAVIFAYRDGWVVCVDAHGATGPAPGSRVARLDDPAYRFPRAWPEPYVFGETDQPGTIQQAGRSGDSDEARSIVRLPLVVHGEVYGCVSVEHVHQNVYDHRTPGILRGFADRLEQALANAGFYAIEQERAQAAEDLARMRGDFLASVSHELRTPLTAIVGYGELLEARWGTMSEEARLKHVRRIVWSANRQVRMVQDLMLVGRLDLQALNLDCRPANLASQVQLAVAEVQGSYRGQQIRIDGSTGTLVLADSARLAQILVNVLDNAAKYSPEGSTIEVTWEGTATEAVVYIRDQGLGIPDEGRQRLFTRFGRISGSRIRAGRVGTGLGLFLGRELARVMGGDLALEATGPQGSTFSLRLPLALAKPAEPDR